MGVLIMIFWIVLGTALGIIGWMIAYIAVKYMIMRDLEENQQEWNNDDRITVFMMSLFCLFISPVIIIIGLIYLLARIAELLFEKIMFLFFGKIEAKFFPTKKGKEKLC